MSVYSVLMYKIGAVGERLLTSRGCSFSDICAVDL